jgi:hypothetical protein
MTEVAPGVLFSDFDIFPTPALAFAIVFICRTSSLVHSRRTIALAIFAPVFVKRPCITRHDDGNGIDKAAECTIHLESSEAFTHLPMRVQVGCSSAPTKQLEKDERYNDHREHR